MSHPHIIWMPPASRPWDNLPKSDKHMSGRNVDAVLDGVGTPRRQPSGSGDASGDEEPDYLAPLLQRTLRRRGLSDSSIHSMFTSQAAEDEADAAPPQTPLSRTEAAWLESGSATTPTAKERSAGGSSLSGSELGTSPPGASAPIASTGGPKLARRSSRGSRIAARWQDAEQTGRSGWYGIW
ncbi:hypothetical protein DFH08DRAFT_948325 [Mycena albidolilacea]|uniref:Uncharacterized protein n=1 Tax=Mycena albidolilacea TaxID=1033008 RepID=A0AAD7F2E5_9AGAR|nr:hypothetical protein DFH08DRAFT_948325 [Mycena albidolilacea]